MASRGGRAAEPPEQKEDREHMTEETSALVPAAPAGGQLTFGQTALRADQFIPPRVKIIQKMSEEVTTGQGEPGDFFNTLTGENYGSSFKFLPIQPFMNRVLLVRDENREKVDKALVAGLGKGHELSNEGGVLKCRSLDMIQGVGEPGVECEVCPLSKWGPSNTPPLCTEVYNFAALHEDGDLIIIQFQKSSAKAGKRLISMLRFVGPGVAPWARFHRVDTHEETIKGKGSFAVPVVTRLPDIPPAELLRQATSWASQLAGIGPIDVTPATDDEAEAEAATDGDAPF